MIPTKKNLFTVILFISFIGISYAQEEKNIFFEPVEGKIVGIWPQEYKLQSPAKLRDLKDKFGFNYILIAAPYGKEWLDNVKKSGYGLDHVMKQLHYGDLIDRPDWFWNNIDETGKVWAYYFDEPISRKFSFTGIVNLMRELSDRGFYPHAQFVIGELDERKAIRFNALSDVIMYSGYGSQEKDGIDQAQSWHEWKNYLGKNFSMVWISSIEDSLQYNTLLKTASDLGMKGVWLYEYEPLPPGKETSDENIFRFCEAAVKYGFLRIKKNPK